MIKQQIFAILGACVLAAATAQAGDRPVAQAQSAAPAGAGSIPVQEPAGGGPPPRPGVAAPSAGGSTAAARPGRTREECDDASTGVAATDASSKGMQHLHNEGIVHRDLAARSAQPGDSTPVVKGSALGTTGTAARGACGKDKKPPPQPAGPRDPDSDDDGIAARQSGG
jgi:hypothetical protein